MKSRMAPLLSSDLSRDFLLLLAIGAFMAAIGAFDTDGAHLARRFAYWVGLMIAAGVTHRFLEAQIASTDIAKSFWGKGVLLTALMTVALTPVVWLVSSGVFGAALSINRLVGLAPGVLVVNAALVALLGVTQHRAPREAALSLQASTPDVIRDLLPAPMRDATLHALQAEDHYVRVHTSAGASLIRITMREAVGALDPALGFQTHRSWWVREASIIDVRWKRGRAMLRLENDIEAPVSRSFAKDLTAAKRL
ncbi:MAG: LytTR family DNA-binding domain-containing protein [Pseudomonadota bacterium]